jgi:phosphatidylserine/phosphatidylglycerophosphate/cardiolipin synthase-like enzyme
MNKLGRAFFLLLIVSASWPIITIGQEVNVFFSPRGGCTEALIEELSHASISLDIAAYQLTSRPVAEAIVAARDRGVAIRIVVDRTQESTQSATPSVLNASRVPMRTDLVERIQHNKYVVIDGMTVITGSFNWSEAAETRNAENLVVIDDEKTAAKFSSNFQSHWNHSRPFAPSRVANEKRSIPRTGFSNPRPRPR